MYNYDKYLYLPSGGLSYSPHVFLSPITNEHTLFSLDIYNYDSYVELISLTLKKYTKFENNLNILDLYVKDALYIWMYFLTTDLSNTTEIVFPHKCVSCDKEVKIYLDFSTSKINILNRYNNTTLNNLFTLNDFTFTFEFLTLKKLLELSNLLLECDDDTIVSEYIRLRIISQIKELKYQNEVLSINEYMDVLNSLKQEQIHKLLNYVDSVEDQIGLYDNFVYRCDNCQHINKFQFFNYLLLAYISPKENYKIDQLENFIFSLLSIASNNNISIEDFLKFPLRFDKQLTNVLESSKSVQAFNIIYESGRNFQT